MIKLVVFSDCHGSLPVIKEEFDLLLIAGDITPATWYHSKSKIFQREWLLEEFKTWLDNLPYRTANSKVIVVPGNHDCVFEDMSITERIELGLSLGSRFELLIHEKTTFTNVSDAGNITQLQIFGTPYCKRFGKWSFMEDNDVLEKLYNEIPEGLDILITHDPPTLNKLGTITQGYQEGKDVGNEILSKRILEIKPKYVFSGHIHSGNHKLEEYEGVIMANVAYVDEYYCATNKVLKIEI